MDDAKRVEAKWNRYWANKFLIEGLDAAIAGLRKALPHQRGVARRRLKLELRRLRKWQRERRRYSYSIGRKGIAVPTSAQTGAGSTPGLVRLGKSTAYGSMASLAESQAAAQRLK